MTAPNNKDALFCFATRGFNFFARKTNLDTPEYSVKQFGPRSGLTKC